MRSLQTDLWKHMADEHGLTLLDSEIHEIQRHALEYVDHVPDRYGQKDYEFTTLEKLLVIVAHKWGNEYGGSYPGMAGRWAIEILERNSIDWKNAMPD